MMIWPNEICAKISYGPWNVINSKNLAKNAIGDLLKLQQHANIKEMASDVIKQRTEAGQFILSMLGEQCRLWSLED